MPEPVTMSDTAVASKPELIPEPVIIHDIITISGHTSMRQQLQKRLEQHTWKVFADGRERRILLTAPKSKGTLVRILAEVLDLTHWNAHQGHPREYGYQKTITA